MSDVPAAATGLKLVDFLGEANMHCRLIYLLAACALAAPLTVRAQAAGQQNSAKNGVNGSSDTQPMTKVPKGVILVKGAWSSASDSVTPLPEDGNVTNNVFDDRYFGIT